MMGADVASYELEEIMHVENYPDFEKLVHIVQHGVQGFIVKKIKGESTEANDLSHNLWKWVWCVNNSKCYQLGFHKT